MKQTTINMTRIWNFFIDHSYGKYGKRNEVIYNTDVLWLQQCLHFSKRWNCCHSSSCYTNSITKINEATIDDAEESDLVMPMYNLIEWSSSYSETTGNLWFHSKDEANSFSADIANNNNFKSFEYRAKLLGNIVVQPNPNFANGILKNATVTVLLKYLSKFRRSLEIPVINCK